jgi:hypothetical protein
MAVKKKAVKKKRKKVTSVAVADMTEKERIQRAQHLETIHLPKSCLTLSRDVARGKVKMGRPSDYTPATVESLLRFIAAGLPIERASAAARVSKETLYQWKKTFPDFSDAIAHAESQYANLCHITINEQIVGGDGHLALKTLQSRFSKDYSTSKKVEMQTMSFSSTISPEQLMEMQQQRNSLDTSESQSDAFIDLIEEPEGSGEQSTLPSTPLSSDPEGDTSSDSSDPTTPTVGGEPKTAPHPHPNPRIEAPLNSLLYCIACSGWISAEEADIGGGWENEGGACYSFVCGQCGTSGMSPAREDNGDKGETE